MAYVYLLKDFNVFFSIYSPVANNIPTRYACGFFYNLRGQRRIKHGTTLYIYTHTYIAAVDAESLIVEYP